MGNHRVVSLRAVRLNNLVFSAFHQWETLILCLVYFLRKSRGFQGN
jgi:hypothetical protein